VERNRKHAISTLYCIGMRGKKTPRDVARLRRAVNDGKIPPSREKIPSVRQKFRPKIPVLLNKVKKGGKEYSHG